MTNNSIWLLGKGTINFWCDSWFDISISNLFDIPTMKHALLQATICEFLKMGNWNLSNFLVENFLDITGIIL